MHPFLLILIIALIIFLAHKNRNKVGSKMCNLITVIGVIIIAYYLYRFILRQ